MSHDGQLVVFTPYGRKAGSSRVRVFEWLDHLGLQAQVHVFTEGSTAGFGDIVRRPVWALRRHRQLVSTSVSDRDTVLIHREISPLSDGRAEERLLRASAKGIVDLDDGVFWDWGHGGGARRLRPKAPKAVRMVKAADLVIAGNDLIAEWAAQHARSVVVIPSCVEPGRYGRKPDYELRDPPVVGWIGSAATERHLQAMADELLRSHRSRGTRLELVGAPEGSLGPLDQMTTRTPWTEAVAYEAPMSWDAAVMPLPDGLLERSKCGYKLLQYGASGVPALGAPIGVNAEICHTDVRRAGTGGLDALLASPAATRRQDAERLRDLVLQRYSFEANSSRYKAAIFGTQSNPKPEADQIILDELIINLPDRPAPQEATARE